MGRVAAGLFSSSIFIAGWQWQISQDISEALKLRLCSTQVTQGYCPYRIVEGPAGHIGLDVWFPRIAMGRCEPMRNGVAYTSGFCKIL